MIRHNEKDIHFKLLMLFSMLYIEAGCFLNIYLNIDGNEMYLLRSIHFTHALNRKFFYLETVISKSNFLEIAFTNIFGII